MKYGSIFGNDDRRSVLDEDSAILEGGRRVERGGRSSGDDGIGYEREKTSVQQMAEIEDEGKQIRSDEKRSIDGGISYQERGFRTVTTRNLLAELDASSVTNKIEKKYLAEYQEANRQILEYQKQIGTMTEELRERALRFFRRTSKNPVTRIISSIHNGFALWAFD